MKPSVLSNFGLSPSTLLNTTEPTAFEFVQSVSRYSGLITKRCEPSTSAEIKVDIYRATVTFGCLPIHSYLSQIIHIQLLSYLKMIDFFK